MVIVASGKSNVGDGVIVGVGVMLGVRVMVGVGVTLGVAVLVGVGVEVLVEVGVLDGVELGALVWLGEGTCATRVGVVEEQPTTAIATVVRNRVYMGRVEFRSIMLYHPQFQIHLSTMSLPSTNLPVSNPCSLPGIGPHQLRYRQNVAFHRRCESLRVRSST